MHKSSFWYPAELQGYMSAFVIGTFLMCYTIGSILMCVWWLDTGCRKLAKSTDSSERAVQTWKPFSWKVIEGQNVFINLPWRTILDFPMYSNLCRCTAHYRLFKLQQVITMNRETAGNHVPFQRLTYLLSQEQQNQTTGQLCVVYHHFICLTTRPAMLLIGILP